MAIEISSQSAMEHILKHRPERVASLALHVPLEVANERVQELVALARTKKVPVHQNGPKKERVPEPLTASLHPFQFTEPKAWLQSLGEVKKGMVLVLDHLQDSQNFGALCRTAEAFGVLGIVIPKDRSVGISAGVYQSSVGAVETIPVVQVPNVGEILRKLKDREFWIIGSHLGEGSHPIEETPDFEKKVLVLGAELEGISSLTRDLCDWLIEIPMRGKVQSFNVSAAGAILMYELT